MFYTSTSRVQAIIPTQLRTKLYAYQQQAEIGPNLTDCPSSSIFFSIFSYLGVKDCKDTQDVEVIKWEEWNALRRMSKKGAATRYLLALSIIFPNFLEWQIPIRNHSPISIREAVWHYASLRISTSFKAYRARKYDRILTLINLSATTIQRFLRTCVSWKRFSVAMLMGHTPRINKLKLMLANGLSVLKFIPHQRGAPERKILKLVLLFETFYSLSHWVVLSDIKCKNIIDYLLKTVLCGKSKFFQHNYLSERQRR